MKVLLDTNIIIHREAANVVRSEIGILFRWLDQLHYEKCIHPLTIEEISKHKDPRVVQTFQAKVGNYKTLNTIAPDTPEIAYIKANLDRSENDLNDSSLLNEIVTGRIDLLITEDRNIHAKASDLGFATSIYTIDGFLERVNAENPDLAEYKVLSVKKEYFGNLNLNDVFFDSFREDYPGFDSWFNKKAQEVAYVCTNDTGNIVAFLYVKPEGLDENYGDISPPLPRKRHLKIGTLKVVSNGFKLGERFIKIIFDNAVRFNVEEIYVTAFDHGDNKLRLVKMLKDWGFVEHGWKTGPGGSELVLVRVCTPEYAAQFPEPKQTYPYAHSNARKWVVPIYPAYHTELFPDSILNTESPQDFIEQAPNRNAISKVYISRSFNRDLSPGDIIVFYRTASGGSAWYTSVATTLGIVQSVITEIRDEHHFIELCRKRSVFTDEDLAARWNYDKRNKPFVVNFLYQYSFPKRMNRQSLVEQGILGQRAPRGFEPMTDEQFEKLLGGSGVDRDLIIN
ncbi:MAG: hypothetical protein DDT32_01880 [Syntrophomonadaceae bacterium]|nr:hypothetical protein [Bacillota bacterium]MBT9148110.1 hypothetical protein [Bacillota bacterium]